VTDDDGATGKAGKDMTVMTQAGAKFEYSDLQVSPTQVTPGQNVTASATVKNVGNASGTATAELKVDGQIRDSKSIYLSPGESKRVSFTFSFTQAEVGDHQVTIDDLPPQKVTVSGVDNSKRILWLGRGDWGIEPFAGCQTFRKYLEAQRYSVDSSAEKRPFEWIWQRELAKYGVVVLAGRPWPLSDIQKDYIEPISTYLSRGGNLLLLVDTSTWTYVPGTGTSPVAEALGVGLSYYMDETKNKTFIIKDPNHNFANCRWLSISQHPKSWFCPFIEKGGAGGMIEHPITQGVGKVYLYETRWYIKEAGPSTVIAKPVRTRTLKRHAYCADQI
jgi:hypothetical protein